MVLVETAVQETVQVPELTEPVARRIVRAACRSLGRDRIHTVEVNFVDEDTMRDLNERHRGLDTPTDVLSFPMSAESGDEAFPSHTGPDVLGNVIVCPSQAAGDMNRLWLLGFLVAHGVLHLLGWSHDEDAAAMHRETWSVLAHVLPIEE